MPSANPDIANLSACADDVRRARVDFDNGPDNLNNFHELRARLEAVRTKLPPLYNEAVFQPFVSKLDQLGSSDFTQIVFGNGEQAQTLFDIAQAILQNGEHFKEKETGAFQEVISDLYDGFLSAEDRRGVRRPDLSTIPPLVKWGRPDIGPYTRPTDATNSFGVKAAIVSLPPANASGGLLSWVTLGHETTGHELLHADIGLLNQLKLRVKDALEQELGSHLAAYWCDHERMDEAGADVLGILNMGPAAGIGLIGFLRGMNAANFNGSPKLRSVDAVGSKHPADIARGYLAAATVRLLEFSQANQWASVIERETDRDAESITLGGISVAKQKAKQSAEIVARTLVTAKVEALEHHALGEIQNWRDTDEEIVTNLRNVLLTVTPLSDPIGQGFFAAHVVAAVVLSALLAGSDIPLLFNRMITTLKLMHNKNPSWGPLLVTHPGNLAPHFAYR